MLRRSKLCCLLLAACMTVGSFSACGKDGQGTESSGASEGTSVSVADWMKGNLAKPVYVSGMQNWACVETWEPALPEPDFEHEGAEGNEYAVLGSNLFVLASYAVKSDAGNACRQVLYRLDGNTRECKAVTPFWEEQGIQLNVDGMEAVADETLAVRGTMVGGEGAGSCLLLWNLSDGTGTVIDTSAVDSVRASALSGIGDQWCDARGNVFLVTFDHGSDGQLISCLHIFGRKDASEKLEELRSVEAELRAGFYCRLADGTPLAYVDNVVVCYDVQSGVKEAEVFTVSDNAERGGFVDAKGRMFSWMPSSGEVRCWNPADNSFDKLLNLKNYDVPVNEQGNLLMGMDQAGQLLVLPEDSGKLAVYVCAATVEADLAEGNLSVANLWYNDNNVKVATIQYGSLHPESPINYYIGSGEEKDAFYERTLMDVMSGQGPDILYVFADDMEKLYQKGALADLSGVLDDSTREQLFSSVLASGTRDGKLVGLPASVEGWGIVTVKGNWAKNSWTYAEAIGLWKQRKAEGAICFLADSHTRESLLSDFLLMNVADSPFLNLEDGSCDFDNELFRQALELIAGCKCGESQSSALTYEAMMAEKLERIDQTKQGQYLAESGAFGGVGFMSGTGEKYGEEIFFPGYPSESGNGNLIHSYGYLVVNAKTEHWEEAADFLRYYYSKEFQTKRENRSDILRKDVYREQYEVQDGFILDKQSGNKIDDRKEGESYLDAAMAYLDGCAPEPAGIGPVQEIIREEAEAYFQGSQNLDNTVRNVQNRVQLYLDENN